MMLDLTDCFYSTARYYDINPYILMAIAKVESNFNPKAVNRNKNGTVDRGIMQINSVWDNYLKERGINPKWIWHACYNIHIGAMILKHCQNIYGNTWRAVDCYNKGIKRAKDKSQYTWKVYIEFQNLLRTSYPFKTVFSF